MADQHPLKLVEMIRLAGIPLDGEDASRAEAWAIVFDEFLALRRQAGYKVHAQARRAWERFLTDVRKLPWEATKEDIQAWAEALAGGRLSPSTVYKYVRDMEMFLDLAAPGQPNPARRAFTHRYTSYKEASWLCKEEVEALLGCIDRETSLLGKRDFALLLLYFITGQEADVVRTLQWGAIERDEKGVWVRWRRGEMLRLERLPAECWQAVEDFLSASGRMGGMRPESYIFAPQADPSNRTTGRAEEWAAERPLSMVRMHQAFQRYLDWAGLAVPGLRVFDLRYTALMLRLEQGMDERDLADWLGVQRKTVNLYIKALRQKPVTQERLEAAKRAWEKGIYARVSPGGPPGIQVNLKHGFYASHLPQAGNEVARRQPEVDSEYDSQNPVGLEAGIANLEAMMQRLLMLADQSASLQESLRLVDVYSQVLARLANIKRIQAGLGASSAADDAAEERRIIIEAVNKAAKEWNLD